MAVYDLGVSPRGEDDGAAAPGIRLDGIGAQPGHPQVVPQETSRPSASDHNTVADVAFDNPCWQALSKRLIDVVLAAFGLMLAAPIMLAVAAAIKMNDISAPVIFCQTRVGRNGRPFRMYKFRTMVVDAERRIGPLRQHNQGHGPLFKLEDDPRVTRVGRWIRRYSLDELPQLINVLGGSMSIVGPRPPLPDEVLRYQPHEHRRMHALPGLTGLWQVSGRSLLSWEESIRLDLSYVEEWSLRLDFQIMARTVVAVLNKRGAY